MAAFPPESVKKSTSSRPSNKVGSYCFTRSSSSRYEPLGAAAKSDASSCTSYIKQHKLLLQQGGESKSRRVLSDITNNIAVPDDAPDQNPTATPPRKLSLDVDSQCFSAMPRSEDDHESSQLKRKAPHASYRSGNKAGATTATFAKCNGKAISKGGPGPVAESILRAKVSQGQSKKLLVSREGAVLTPARSQSPPSKLSSLRKKILEKVAGKSIAKPKNQVLRRSISKEEFRRLSLVLRSEQELLDKSKTYEDQLHALQQQCQSKEAEIESVRNVGKMLGKLCVNQAEELKALKGMFPPTLREVVQLRELCKKQEQELRDARTVVPSLQEQVKLLTTQLDLLANDIEKVKAARLARRALTSDLASVKSAVGSNSTQQGAQHVEESSRQAGLLKVSNSLTENLGSVMERLNLASEKDLSPELEERCARAFQELGFSRRKSDVSR